MQHGDRGVADAPEAAFDVDQPADVLLGPVLDGRLDVDEAAPFPLQPVAGKA